MTTRQGRVKEDSVREETRLGEVDQAEGDTLWCWACCCSCISLEGQGGGSASERHTQDTRGQPQRQVSGEVEQCPKGPVDVVSADLSCGGEVGGASGEAQPIVKDQRHPGRLGTLGPGPRDTRLAVRGACRTLEEATHLSLWKSA